MEDYMLEFEQIGKDIIIGVRELDEIALNLDKYNETEDTELFTIADNIESIGQDFEALKSKIETISYNLENDTTVNFENVDIKEYIYFLQFIDTNNGLKSLIDELKFIRAIN